MFAVMRTPSQALADHLLRQPVEDWARDRRAEKKSWRRIALELRDVTKGKIEVSERTVRIWAGPDEVSDEQPSAAAS